ncbi:MAG: PhnD/SsuA/transferrin family substrate-binding protein [Rhodobacteraceae bacterium]|nr:PhnD/SsuA/transferrin family substrate-binding protein [Paracoccaceae bacterium]
MTRAALPMYDRAEIRPATDRLWAEIRDRLRAAGIDAPDALERPEDPWEVWQAPDLVLAQTCGLPYRRRLHGHVTLVGTPDYGLEGLEPGHYSSALVARAGDGRDLPALAGGVLAINEAGSQSGWAAIHAHAAAQGLEVSRAIRTGAHLDSARAVAEGRADLAALDAVTWRLIGAHDPALAAALRVVARTAPTPGLPLITGKGRDPAPVFAAVAGAIAALHPGDRAALGLRGLVAIPASAYLAVPIPPDPPIQ